MSPTIKTAISTFVPILLATATFALPKLVPLLPGYVSGGIVVLLAFVAVANVFHIPAAAVDVMQALVMALQPFAGSSTSATDSGSPSASATGSPATTTGSFVKEPLTVTGKAVETAAAEEDMAGARSSAAALAIGRCASLNKKRFYAKLYGIAA